MKFVPVLTLITFSVACGTHNQSPMTNDVGFLSDASGDQSLNVSDAMMPVTDAMRPTSALDSELGPISTDPSALIINEVLYDPGPDSRGDANGDGNRDAYEDEFIEFVNTGGLPLNAGGLTIYDEQAFEQGTPRHLIPDNTIIPPRGALLVFGGGSPTGDFGGSIVQVANGLNNQLNINNSGESVRVFNQEGREILVFDGRPYTDDPNASISRYPDVSGGFTQHDRIDLNGDGEDDDAPYSPGVRANGESFSAPR